MPDFYAQYSPIAGQIAAQNNIPQSIFFGLIQTESSWNPYADAPSSTAYGFTQLLRGTASDLGVNRYNPIENLQGGASYLASMPGSNWTEKLAHYYQGPGATIGQSGLDYAGKVLNAAKKFISGDSIGDIASAFAGNPAGLIGNIGNSIFGGGESCGLNPICYLRQWIASTGFFQRLALATLAFLFVLGGLYLMKEK